MKRILPLLTALSLAGCAKSAPTSSLTSLPASEMPASTPAETAVLAPSEDPRAYMEPYECMEIAFLGVTDDRVSVQDVIERAGTFPGFSFLRSIQEPVIIKGEQGKTTNNVYFILPAENTELAVGEYNWFAGEITNLWYDEPDSGPIFYVESGESVTPLGKIGWHRMDNDMKDEIYTGFSLSTSHLRTDYHMGTVDTTPYDQFSSGEVPFYDQALHDILMSRDQIRNEVEQGGRLSKMDELFYDGVMYALYDMEYSDGSHHAYAVTLDPNAIHQVMDSPDYQSWSGLGMG